MPRSPRETRKETPAPGKIVAALLTTQLLAPALSSAQDIKGQKPVLILGGAFQFTPRSWGSYVIHNKTADEYCAFTMAVLDERPPQARAGGLGSVIPPRLPMGTAGRPGRMPTA